MTDVFSKEKRSEIMSKASGKDNKTEAIVRKYLFSLGYKYRKNDRRFPGKPDIYIPRSRTAIFVHGCFWHGHKNCKMSKLPVSNRNYWESKITRNMRRDEVILSDLGKLGITVICIWTCEIKTIKNRQETFKKLIMGLEK